MRTAVVFGNGAKTGPYEQALCEAGIEFIKNPTSLEGLDGLVLTGGSDVNPALYGQERAAECDEPDDARDELEMRLLRKALEADLPVLAICRGMQLFNVFHGGSLIQHLPSTELHRRRPQNAESGKHPAAHAVTVKPGTRLAEILGAGEYAVNSRHHQAVDRVAEGLIESAVSDDGVIEALELPDAAFAVAVQWHPEDRVGVSAGDRKLFEAFRTAMESRSRAQLTSNLSSAKLGTD